MWLLLLMVKVMMMSECSIVCGVLCSMLDGLCLVI